MAGRLSAAEGLMRIELLRKSGLYTTENKVD